MQRKFLLLTSVMIVIALLLLQIFFAFDSMADSDGQTYDSMADSDGQTYDSMADSDGQTYYFDLSKEGIPGTVNPALPNSSLKWVPFTYVGEMNAYSRQSEGVSEAGNITVNPRNLFIADDNVTTSVSWDTLDSTDLIFGRPYRAYGADYQLRAPSVGSGYTAPNGPGTNEWDQICTKNSNYIKNWSGFYSWGQDSSSAAAEGYSIRVTRGNDSARAVSAAYSDSTAAMLGFRPVLQIESPNFLPVQLQLNGGRIGNSSETIQIAVNGDADSYPAPSKDGITRPEGSNGSYFRWNTQEDGQGNDYEPGSAVPITVTILYGKWQPIEEYSLATGETYYFDLSGESIPGTVNVGQKLLFGALDPGVPDSTLHYVPFTYIGTIHGYRITEAKAVTEEWAAANQSDRSLFLADYYFKHSASWNALDEQDLIFGRSYQSNNILYQLRAPSVGTGSVNVPPSNEWDRILEKTSVGIPNNTLVSWGQDSYSRNSSSRIARNNISSANLDADSSNSTVGFRPVLEIQNIPDLAPDDFISITVDLGTGSIGGITGSINLVAKKGSSYIAPSNTGITRPSEGEYFMWKGSDNNLYLPGRPVPAEVIRLTALYQEPVTPPVFPTYTVTASAGSGGTISPTGAVAVISGNSQTFSITPDPGYRISDVTVDDADQGAISTYTFSNVTTNHAIHAIFNETNNNDNDNDNDNGSSSGSSSTPSTPNYQAELIAGNGQEKNLPITVSKADGTASVDGGTLRFSQGKTVITLPSLSGVNTYILKVPVTGLSMGDAQGKLTLKTDAGRLAVPLNMLAGVSGINGSNVELSIGTGDRDALSDDIKSAIGNRPILQLKLSIDGKQTDWSNPNAPVTVSIPYTPTAAELANPEGIVVWYIDGSGKAVSIPNGRYHPDTGMVTFFTTHFSSYAVAYVPKTFQDLDRTEWARAAIESMASKGIVNGKGNNTFSPASNITRADYMVLLIHTLGLTAQVTENYDDIKPDAYYYQAVGIGKKFGITTGSGDNLFHPTEYLSRQDMMVLAARGLEKCQGMKVSDSSFALEKFSDKEDVAEYASDSLAALIDAGLIEGSGNLLHSRSNTTRAEAAVFLYKIYDKYPEAPVAMEFKLSESQSKDR